MRICAMRVARQLFSPGPEWIPGASLSKEKLDTKRKAPSEASEDKGPFWKRQKRDAEFPKPSTQPSTTMLSDMVTVSLPRLAWQYVVQLIKEQIHSEVPPVLRAMMEKNEFGDDQIPTNQLATTAGRAVALTLSDDKENKSGVSHDLEAQPGKGAKRPSTKKSDRRVTIKADAKPQTSEIVNMTTVIGEGNNLNPKVNISEEVLKPHFKPFRVGKDDVVGKTITMGNEDKGGWREAVCEAAGSKVHFQVCIDDRRDDLHPLIQDGHAQLIGRAFADKNQRLGYSEDDADLTQTMLQERGTLSFSVWAFGNRRAKEKTLAGSVVVTRGHLDELANVNVYVLSLIAVDRQWRRFGIGRSLLQTVEKHLRAKERADLIIAHGLRPNFYLKNGYVLNPRELPCPFKPKDRSINFFCKALNPNLSFCDLKKAKPKSIELLSDSLRACYAEYQFPRENTRGGTSRMPRDRKAGGARDATTRGMNNNEGNLHRRTSMRGAA